MFKTFSLRKCWQDPTTFLFIIFPRTICTSGSPDTAQSEWLALQPHSGCYFHTFLLVLHCLPNHKTEFTATYILYFRYSTPFGKASKKRHREANKKQDRMVNSSGFKMLLEVVKLRSTTEKWLIEQGCPH